MLISGVLYFSNSTEKTRYNYLERNVAELNIMFRNTNPTKNSGTRTPRLIVACPLKKCANVV